MGMWRNGINTTPSYFKIIIREGWKIFINAELEDLLCCQCNNTTSAWSKTGLYPFNPFCEAWENVLETMGPLNKCYKETIQNDENIMEYEIKLKNDVSPFSDGEKVTLTTSCNQENYLQAAYFHMRIVLVYWKQCLQFDKLAKPNPTSAPQIIAQWLFQFVERSHVAFKKNAIEAKSRSREKRKASQMQDKLRQLLDCTTLTNSLPATFQYFIALQSICSVGISRVNGHTVKITMDSFMVYLKDQWPPFRVNVQCLLDVNSFQIRRPDIIMSSEDKLNIQRRTMWESKRKEEIKIKARKGEAERARSKWTKSEYEKMANQIKANSHTFQDFAGLFEKLSQPFEHRSNDGYLMKCTYNQSMCVTSIALQAIDGFLYQKCQAEKLRWIHALEKKCKTTRRKCTPNTTRGDDGIGVLMSLQDYDFILEEEVKVEGHRKLNKDISQHETNLKEFITIKAK